MAVVADKISDEALLLPSDARIRLVETLLAALTCQLMPRLTVCGPRKSSDGSPGSIEVTWNSFRGTRYSRRFAGKISDEISISSCRG